MKANRIARLERLEEREQAAFMNRPEVKLFLSQLIQATRELFGDEGYARLAARIQELEALHATPPGVA